MLRRDPAFRVRLFKETIEALPSDELETAKLLLRDYMNAAVELTKDFREEFKGEFDQYFRDASQYAACLDAERARIFEEMQFTAQRYERFLNDSANWETSQ